MFRRLLFATAAALGVLPVLVATAALPETSAVLSGSAFIKSIQDADGSYGTTDLGQNVDAVFAVRASGYDPAKDLVGGNGPVQFLNAKVAGVGSPAAAAKAALGARALGMDPKAIAGIDLIARVNQGYDAAKGTYGGDDFSQSVAMLGLACTGNTVPPAAVAALKSTQLAPGGGWGFGGFTDPDTTAIALQALLASGTPKTDSAITKAFAYLKSSQGNDGGWGFDPSESNASSTAYVIQALIALGENPDAAGYERGGVTPVQFLVSQQQPNGSFKGFDAAYATNQALPALAGRTFCNAPDSPVTRTRPAAAATPVPSPSATPVASQTAAPKPPSTGTGERSKSAGGLPAISGIAVLCAGAAALSAGRWRRR